MEAWFPGSSAEICQDNSRKSLKWKLLFYSDGRNFAPNAVDVQMQWFDLLRLSVESSAAKHLAAPTSHPIPSHPIPSHPIPSHPIPSHPIPSHPIPSHPIPSHGGLLENAEAHVHNVELCLWYFLRPMQLMQLCLVEMHPVSSSHFLMVGTGFLIVHGVVWLRRTQRMMTTMRKTRSQCSCCLRRLALLGLPRGSPGVQRKQVIRMIWRLSFSPTMLTLFKRSWHWRSFCSRRQWQIWIEDHLQKRPLNCSGTSLQRLIWG